MAAFFPPYAWMVVHFRQIFTISIGDALEIHSGNDLEPFVGKLILLDRGKRRCKVLLYDGVCKSERGGRNEHQSEYYLGHYCCTSGPLVYWTFGLKMA